MFRQLLDEQWYPIGPGDQLLNDLLREGFATGEALHHRFDLRAS
jgi:hypothetical protein